MIPSKKQKSKSATGKPLENRIIQAARIYEQRGVCTLRKCDPPTRTIYINRVATTVLLPSPYSDFTGCYTARGGRMLQIEAKSTQEPRLPFWGAAGFTLAQYDAMSLWERSGAACGIVWELATPLPIGIPPQPFGWRFVSLALIRSVAGQMRGMQPRRSVRWDEALEIPAGEGLRFDFMATIAKLF